MKEPEEEPQGLAALFCNGRRLGEGGADTPASDAATPWRAALNSKVVLLLILLLLFLLLLLLANDSGFCCLYCCFSCCCCCCSGGVLRAALAGRQRSVMQLRRYLCSNTECVSTKLLFVFRPLLLVAFVGRCTNKIQEKQNSIQPTAL